MITRILPVAGIFFATVAMAQPSQNDPTTPSNPAAPHTPQVNNQTECWDVAANRPRNPQTDGAAATAIPSQTRLPDPVLAAPTANPPPGMKTC